MNVTDFKNKVLSLNLNEAENIRIKHLTAKYFKFKVRTFTNIKEVNKAMVSPQRKQKK